MNYCMCMLEIRVHLVDKHNKYRNAVISIGGDTRNELTPSNYQVAPKSTSREIIEYVRDTIT
jgi:hypothetical protein